MGIKAAVKKVILKILPESIISKVNNSLQRVNENTREYEEYINLSFSQEGEDLILHRLIGHKNDGFYVDVGAHHPYRFSNTFKFYLLGWTGINIDALPGSLEAFNEKRPKDINLEIPILNDTSVDVTYYMFDEPALNTFDLPTAQLREASSVYKIVNRIKLRPYKLGEILAQHLKEGQKIDFLSVDVEGMDLEVLISNDWGRYRPRFIVAESLSTILMQDLESEISKFLYSKGYAMISKTANSIIYSVNE